MKIALASQPTLDDSIALNVNRIEKALASLRKKVDLVAFGESYLQGFNSLKWNFERDRTVAVSVDSQPIKMLRYTAKKYSVAVSFGYYELCDEAIYSSYMFIGKNGEIVNNFRRVSKDGRSMILPMSTIRRAMVSKPLHIWVNESPLPFAGTYGTRKTLNR